MRRRSIVRSQLRCQARSAMAASAGWNIRSSNPLALIKSVNGVLTDSVGLSGNALLAALPTNLKSLLFSDVGDSETKYDDETCYNNIIASSLFNNSNAVGVVGRSIAVYAESTEVEIITKAKKYYGTLPGRYYHGMNKHGAYQTWTNIPVADFYVDSTAAVSGDGSISSPFKSISDLPGSMNIGTIIGLIANSYWREQLSAAVAGVKIYGCGTGRRPKLDCADIIQNATFVVEDAPSATYRITWLPETTGKNYPSVWEDGILLKRVSTLALCKSTAGSFYASTTWTEGVAQNLYVHASDSSDITTNGKVYESAVREYGVYSGASAEVYHVHGSRNKNNNGAIVLMALDSYTENCVGSEGVVHNIFVAGRNNVNPTAIKNCVGHLMDPTISGINFISYQTTQTGLDLVYDDVLATNYSDRDVFPAASAAHAHGNVGAYRNVRISGIATYCTGLCGFDAKSVVIDDALAFNCGSIYSGGCPDVRMQNSEWYIGNILPAPTYWQGVWNKKDRSSVRCINSVFNFYKYGAVWSDLGTDIQVDKCSFIAGGVSEYFAIGGNKSNGTANTSLILTNSVFYGLRNTAKYLEMSLGGGHTVAINNDNNIYSNPNARFLCGSNINGGAVMYSVAEYLGVVGSAESNAYIGDPEFVGDPRIRNYAFASGGAADTRGCGARVTAKTFDQANFIANIFPSM